MLDTGSFPLTVEIFTTIVMAQVPALDLGLVV